MALRVLLADESSTIKKVFQLALQDFAVDVKSVSLGLDVMPVAHQFKPDIIFCDVLLQKKSGYEVCAELKANPQAQGIPVVLMWSSFMEIDQDRLQAARANGHLEKPFDVKDLRKLVQDLVPRTKNQRLGTYLSFPKMPEMLEAGGAIAPEPEKSSWNMESFDPIPSHVNPEGPDDDFQEVPLPPPPKAEDFAALDREDENEATQWSAKALGRFQVDVSVQNQDEMDVALPDEEPTPPPAKAPPPKRALEKVEAQPAGPAISNQEMERIVRSQAQGIIEAVVWKVVPDLATQIIERELKRLLDEKSANP